MKSKLHNSTLMLARALPDPKEATNTLLALIRQDKVREIKENPLLLAYIVSVCSAIESVINRQYAFHFARIFGNRYKEFSTAFTSMNIDSRLLHLFPTISNFKYELDQNNPTVKYVLKVFRLRNKLIHQPQELFELKFIDNGKGGYHSYHPDLKSAQRFEYLTEEWPSISKKDLIEIQKIVTHFFRFINFADFFGDKKATKKYRYLKLVEKKVWK